MRKSVTLPAHIFELIDKLEDTFRLMAYDIIFRAMFENKPIEYNSSNIPDVVKNVLICAKYELKKIKSKYENGCVEKTYNEVETFACKNERSKKNQITAKESTRARDICNTNNNLNTNKEDLEDIVSKLIHKLGLNYNNKSICLSESLNDDFDEPTRIKLYLQNICEQIQEYDKLTKYKNSEQCFRLEKLFRRLAKSSEPIGIGDEILFPVQILDKISGAFPRAKGLERFIKRFDELCKIAETSAHNQYRYLVASIYNEI